MTEADRKPIDRGTKIIVAGLETAFFGIAGVLYPPLFLGMIVTTEEVARQNYLKLKETRKYIDPDGDFERFIDRHNAEKQNKPY